MMQGSSPLAKGAHVPDSTGNQRGTGNSGDHSRRSEARARRQQERARRNRITVISLGVAAALILLVGFILLSATAPAATTSAPAASPSPSTLPTAPPAESAPAAETTPAASTPAAIQPDAEPFTESVIGMSVQSEPITALVFGDGERKYLLVGGVHGDEWGADAAEALVARLKSDPTLVPTGTQIHVIPCLNPDGRKLDTRGNANQVDLNRNMPSKNWSSKLDPNDSSATRGLSGGTAPESEPESKAFTSYMSQGFLNVVSIHSKGGLVDWDGSGGDVVAQRIAAKVGYPVKHLGYQAYIRGSMGLYVPEVWGIPIVTIEMGQPGLSDKLLAGILAAFE